MDSIGCLWMDMWCTQAVLERSVCGLSFDYSSSRLVVIGVDDKHTLNLFDLSQDPPRLVGEMSGQNGSPGAINNIVVRSCAVPPSPQRFFPLRLMDEQGGSLRACGA